MLRSTFDVFRIHSFQEHNVFFRYLWKAVESNICNFGIFDWVFFSFPCCSYSCRHNSTVMFRHFHAKSLEIAKQDSERLFNFSPHQPRIHAHGLLVPWPSGNTNIVYLLYPIKARINVIKMALHLSIQNI